MLLAHLTGLSLAAAAPPTFADSFYTGMQLGLVQNQGGYAIDKGVCCDSTKGGSCKVETQSIGADVREDTSKERMRQDSAHGVIVNWAGTVKKQMALAPGPAVNSTHKWACMAYCPLTKAFTSTLAIGEGKKPNIKDLGQATIQQPAAIGNGTRTCEHYKFVERLVIILMSQTDFYIDESAKPPAPWYKHLILEPFAKKIGYEKTYYVGYQPIDNTDYFDIDFDPKKCKKSTKCQSSSEAADAAGDVALPGSTLAASPLIEARSMYDAVAEAAAVQSLELGKPKPKPPPPNVSFTGDFIAQESAISLIDQGGERGPGQNPDDPCCREDRPQCQVQLSQSKGTRYYDYTNQRTRYENGFDGSIVIDDYSAHKTYSVTSSAGVETCKEYCPIDVNDTMRVYDPFSPFDPIKDLGKTTIDGKTAEHYQWKEKVLHIITMSQTDFYADISDPKHAVPLFMSETLEPLGRQIGKNNRSWTNFTYTAVPPAKFAVQGVDKCPMSKHCRSQENLHNALRSRNYHTLLRGLKEPMLEHAVGGFTPKTEA